MKRLLLILFLATAASAGTFTTREGIEYAAPGGESLLMDLRVPDGRGPHPVILYLHSGAWITSDRTGRPAIRQDLGVAGASAGGHIAAVLGTSGGVDSLEGLALGNPQFSSRVKVVVDLYGPTEAKKRRAVR